MKKWSGDISKLYLYTEFQENRPIRLVSSDAHRQTDTQTHTHTHTHIRTDIFCKPHFWTQGTSKRIIPQKSQHRIFLPSQYFLHTYCIWEKVKNIDCRAYCLEIITFQTIHVYMVAQNGHLQY